MGWEKDLTRQSNRLNRSTQFKVSCWNFRGDRGRLVLVCRINLEKTAMSTTTTTEIGHRSASFLFDSYAYVRRLRDAGMDEQQAAIQAETFLALAEDRLATKQDIAELKLDIETTKAELKRDIAESNVRIALVEANLKRDLASLDGKVETTKESLRKEIEVAKNETIKWMVGLALAQLAMMAGILMTLVRVLPGGH